MTVCDNLAASDDGTADAAGVTLAFVAADVTGVRGVRDPFSQHDAADGNDQSTYERWVNGVSGGTTPVATAAGGYG